MNSDRIQPRVLIAEDEEAIRVMLARIIKRAGIEANVAENGRAALEELRRSEYDVLLLDLTMPQMSGYDVVNELREWRNRPPVIVLTANAREDGKNLDGTVVLCVIKKPFDINVLIALLRDVGEAVHEARKRGTYSAPPPVRAFSSLLA